MASQSEFSYGSRLSKARDISVYISTFQGYDPPRSEESATSYAQLISDTEQANLDEASAQQMYNAKVRERFLAYKGPTKSFLKILSPIVGALKAQYGYNSREANYIAAIVARAREGRLSKQVDENGNVISKMSQSEQSYGAWSSIFAEIIVSIEGFGNYNPGIHHLELPQLALFGQHLKDLNAQVMNLYISHLHILNHRRDLYNDLSQRTLRIKTYIKANYGPNSTEYSLVRKLDV